MSSSSLLLTTSTAFERVRRLIGLLMRKFVSTDGDGGGDLVLRVIVRDGDVVEEGEGVRVLRLAA